MSMEGKPVFLSCMDEAHPDQRPIFTIDSPLGSEGSFFFTGLPPGKYHLWMEKVKGCDRFRKPLAAWDLGEGEKLQNVQVYEPR